MAANPYVKKVPVRNRYEIVGTEARLIVTRNDGSEVVGIIDALDVERAKLRRWRVQFYEGGRWGYFVSGRDMMPLGRYLLGCDGLVSYRNHDGLDCRRANLYEADRSIIKATDRQSYRTNTGHHHVSYSEGRGVYRVTITRKGGGMSRTYRTLADAVAARDAWMSASGHRSDVGRRSA